MITPAFLVSVVRMPLASERWKRRSLRRAVRASRPNLPSPTSPRVRGSLLRSRRAAGPYTLVYEPLDSCLDQIVGRNVAEPLQLRRELRELLEELQTWIEIDPVSGPYTNKERNYRRRPSSQLIAGDRVPSLSPETEFLDERAISLNILRGEIVEESAASGNQLQQTAARVVILRVHLKVSLELLNSLRNKRNLDFGRTRVRLVLPVLPNGSLFGLGTDQRFFLFRGTPNSGSGGYWRSKRRVAMARDDALAIASKYPKRPKSPIGA
jgi:hypothetical protein